MFLIRTTHKQDLSPLIREAIISHWQLGHSYSNIVRLINALKVANISKSTVVFTVKRFRETNLSEPRPGRGLTHTARTQRLVRSIREVLAQVVLASVLARP